MKRKSGIALPTVLLGLVALSALALAMTTATQNDIATSGIQERNMATLQIADAALNYTVGLSDNFANPVSQPPTDLRAAGLPFDATVRVNFEPPPRIPPAAIRVSAIKFKFYNFLLNSWGFLKATAPSQLDSSTQLEMEVTKLGPAGTDS